MRMKKQLSLLLFVLGMSANVAFAGGITQLAENMEGGEALIAQIRTVLAQNPVYHAQLTGYASSTGGGVVYVTKDLTSDPRENDYVEGDSNVKVNGTNLAMRGVTDFPVYIAAWAKSNPGYYFVGWSYSDGGTDLASIQVPNPSYDSEDPESEEYLTFPEEEYVNAYDVATTENETINYVVYATFEPYRLTSYTVEGYTTTTSRVSNLTVKCTIDRAGAELTDFESFTIKDPSAGTWVPGSATINGQELSVPVTFTATDDNAGDFSAVLEVKTYAGIAMNVPLRTRTVETSVHEASRYNKNKVKLGEGTLAEMIAEADPTDVIKLNGNYNGQVVATKSFTLDLNGYNITYNFNDLVADYSQPTGQVAPARIAKAAILVKDADAVVTLAYSPYGGKVIAGPYNDAVDVTAGKLVLNGGTLTGFFGIGSMGGDVVQNGATIIASAATQTAVACMGGDYTMTDGKIYGMFGSMGGVSAATVEINGGTIDNTEQTIEGISLEGGIGVQIGANSTAWIRKGTILAKTFGVQSTTTPAGGDITIEKLAVIKGGSYALDCGGGTTTVNCGKFEDPAKLWHSNSGTGTEVFNSGYFQTNTSNVTEVLGKQVWRNTSGAEYREDYNFFAGSAEDAQAAGVSVCHIGGTSYSSLEDALAYANNTSEDVTIIIDNDYTLPAGYYTLPANAAILIPYYDEQGSMTPIVDRINKVDAPSLRTPFEWRRLTLAEGVNLDVFGTIEVSGRQYSNGNLHSGDIFGAYGHLHLNKGSKIVLQNGSILRAWGYVTSGAGLEVSGEIDVRRGATVYELFQMGDWTNPLAAAQGLLSGDEVFPLNTYFIQNIEAPAKYHPGSHLISATTVCESAMGMTVMMSADDIQIIGESRMENPDVAMFLMDEMADAENTWVRKWYDPRTDQQVYDINSGAHIGQLVIPLVSSPLFPQMGSLIPSDAPGILGILGNALSSAGDIPESIIMNSGQYNLPITNNFKLHLLSGRLDFTQNTELLPGSELEVDKEAKITILKSAGQNSRSLYIFDYRDWETWAEGAYARRVQYSPSFNGQPNVRPVDNIEAIGSAKVNVHGTFDTEDGFVFTSEHGGNIFSTVEDAGTFIITMPLNGEDGYDPDYSGDPEDYTVSVSQKSGSATFKPVWLKNEVEDDYTHAGALGELDDVFCYMNFDGTGGKWKKLVFEDCFVKDEADVYYAKPQEYVALANGMTPNSDHTYSDAAGAGRLFILIAGEGTDCQWWEVEAKDNYFHCIHPENDTYYEWDGVRNEWKEKKFTITWKNWDGSIITTYSVPYGTQAEWLSTNPTRPASVDYTYDFTGWSPALGKVTGDVTYMATYEEKQIKYTITFVQDGGMEIERHLLARDEVPVCENVPIRTGYILQWEPGIEPVVGNQTYVATWLPEPPETYTITFKNYDGSVLKKEDGTTDAIYTVEADQMPAYDGATPAKPATNEYEYEFTGWKPALAPATTNATYVAQFSEVEKKYTVIFQNENGSEIERYDYSYGETPVCSATPTKANTTQYTYSFAWTPQIQSVTEAATYRAVFTPTTNKYTVTLQCNVDGACTFTGAGIYEFNTSVTPTATIKDPDAYEFVEWTGTSHNFGTRQVTGDITLSVMVKEKAAVLTDLDLDIDDVETVSSATNYEDVVITSDGLAHSSQIINADNITLYGNADFVLQQTIEAGKWYSIAVPWRVNANGGVYLGDATTPATLGPDFEVIYYDGAVRATQGPGAHCWVYMKNLGSSQKVLEPGRAYMIYLKKNSVSKITFRKTAKANLLTTSTSVNSYPETTDNDGKDANWNAIANPALYHAYINAGSDAAKAQRYLADEGTYDWFYLSAHQLVVGEPIYVQAPSDKSIVANGASYAPRRTNTEPNTTYDVNITADGAAKYADHLSVQINDDKEADKYTIGQDLLKFGVSSKVAQMWINRYDAKLCANTMVSGEESTFFPMSVYAPKAGDYTIAIEREVAAEEYALFLTYNGEAIWNLSEGAYVANLPKGTDANYGLRISVRKAPMTPTAIDEAIVDAQGETRKVLINNQVFIIRGDKVYSINGQLVK